MGVLGDATPVSPARQLKWLIRLRAATVRQAGVRARVMSGTVSGELRLWNGAAVKRINGGCKSLLTAQRSEVKQAGNRRSQAPWAAHSLLV
jgi:hypothetical protein